FLSLAKRALNITLGARRLIAFEPLLRFPKLVERRVRLGAAVLRSVRRRLPHRIGRFLHLAGGVSQFRALLFARQLFQPARGFLQFVGLRALPGAAIARRLTRGRHPALPLGFLLLAPRSEERRVGKGCRAETSPAAERQSM